MVVRVRRRWIPGLVFGGLGLYALVDHGFDAAGFLLAALALVPIVVAFRMRIAADDSGVTIVNLAKRLRIPWTEIEGFGMGSLLLSRCLDVRLTDGKRAHAWVVTTTGGSAYSYDEANSIVAGLQRRLALARGEDPDQSDALALERALNAAERGDFGPLGDFAIEERIDSEQLWGRIQELVDQGRIDPKDQQGTALRKLHRWDRLLLSRRTRELLRAAEQDDHDLQP